MEQYLYLECQETVTEMAQLYDMQKVVKALIDFMSIGKGWDPKYTAWILSTALLTSFCSNPSYQ